MAEADSFHVFRESDGDVAHLANRRIAIVGYGHLGRPLALNLRDACQAQLAVACDADDSRRQAILDGFEVVAVPEAVAGAEIVLLMIPDEIQPAVFREHVRPHLRPGAALVLASGYCLAFKLLEPPAGTDVLLFAPRMIGGCIRELFLSGQGFLSYVSVETDATGRAWQTLLALAKASGALRRGALQLSAKTEAHLDLFIEQSLGPWLGAAVMAAFQVGLEAGLPAEGLLLEMYASGEMAKTFQAMAEQGFFSSVALHGYAAAFGGLMQTMAIDHASIARSMTAALTSIQNGEFAKALQNEVRDGYPYRQMLNQMSAMLADLMHAEDQLRKRLA